MYNVIQSYIDEEPMDADVTGDEIDFEKYVGIYVQTKWGDAGGGSTGTFHLQATVDGVEWFDIQDFSATPFSAVPAADAGGGGDNFWNIHATKLRFFYDATSGNAGDLLTVHVCMKGPG